MHVFNLLCAKDNEKYKYIGYSSAIFFACNFHGYLID